MVTPAVAVVLLLVAGCGDASRNLASNGKLSGGLWSIRVTSDAFRDGQAIPAKYTEDGENVSPPLRWSNGPSGTTGYIIVVEDSDSGRKFPAMHWLVYHIPVGTNELPENASKTANLTQGKNYKGTVG